MNTNNLVVNKRKLVDIHRVNGNPYTVYAVYKTQEDVRNDIISHYEIVDKDFNRLNEGYAFTKRPTWGRVSDLVAIIFGE